MEIDGTRYAGCPVASVDRRLVREAFAMYRHYRQGFLPGAGGILDQRELHLEIIETLDAVLAEIESEEAEKQRRKAGR
jgi:hypothetical protein